MAPTHIADDVVLFHQGLAPCEQLIATRACVFHNIQSLGFCQACKGSRRTNWMSGIRVAMANFGGRIILEHVNNAVAKHQGTKREVAICDSLRSAHHIGLNAPKTRAGPRACASVGGDDLVGDQ